MSTQELTVHLNKQRYGKRQFITLEVRHPNGANCNTTLDLETPLAKFSERLAYLVQLVEKAAPQYPETSRMFGVPLKEVRDLADVRP